jgi:hypothetical protein
VMTMSDRDVSVFLAGLAGMGSALLIFAALWWALPRFEEWRGWRRYRRDCANELRKGPGA